MGILWRPMKKGAMVLSRSLGRPPRPIQESNSSRLRTRSSKSAPYHPGMNSVNDPGLGRPLEPPPEGM